MSKPVPFLCGGIFLSLLVRAEAPQKQKKELREGAHNDVNKTDIVEALSRFIDPTFVKPREGGYGDFCTKYMKCEASGGVFLQTDNEALVAAFDDRVKHHYQKELADMHDFVDDLISKNTTKREELVTSLLSLIRNDHGLDGEQFYAEPDGSLVSKEDLLRQSNICIDSLLLGVWHYIVNRRPNNKDGATTFKAIHKQQGAYKPWEIDQSKIGKWESPITIERSKIVEETENSSEAEPVEAEVVDDIPNEDEKERIPDPATTSQAVFINNGNGIVAQTINGGIHISYGGKEDK